LKRNDPVATDRWLQYYEKPVLIHELGILAGFPDLTLAARYDGTRIGADLFTKLRDYLGREGLAANSERYYQCACQWAAMHRKQLIESVRHCKYAQGYNYLAATDHHWHRTGYCVGMLNEFYENKYGEVREDIVSYNGENVLLVAPGTDRNLVAGASRKMALSAAIFAAEDLNACTLSWEWRGSQSGTIDRQSLEIPHLPCGEVSPLAEIVVTAPPGRAQRLTLSVALNARSCSAHNQWHIWAFPETTGSECLAMDGLSQEAFGDFVTAKNGNRVHLFGAFCPDVFSCLEDGENVLVAGDSFCKQLPVGFNCLMGGRTIGNCTTVLHDHPVLRQFPHDGFSGVQFRQMLHNSYASWFDDPAIPFCPIIEVVSSYKLIRKQAALFELGVDQGNLMVCTLNLSPGDPGARYLMTQMVNYCNSDAFEPATGISASQLRTAAECHGKLTVDAAPDFDLDPNGML
jgi:hypothetical protein